MFEIIPGAASRSPRGEANQDRVAVFLSPGTPSTPGSAGVVVCDGVGSYRDSGAVASEVAGLAVNHLTENGANGLLELEQLMANAHLATADGATTLIALGVEETGLASHIFIGNGSLLEIEPVTPQPGKVQLRWIDLALPQIDWERGRPALRSFIPAPADQFEAVKGRRDTGGMKPRMYLACSDGIATDEDRAQARSARGGYWKAVPAPLVTVVDALAEQWRELLVEDADSAASLLQSILRQALAKLLEEHALDDDASVACVLVRPRLIERPEASA
jgi:hypothetical protein